MKIETCIDSLVSYAMNTGLAEPCDHQVLTNRLLDILHKEDYTVSDEPQSEDLEEILAGLLDYAVANGLCDDGITARDIFDTRIMGAITPMPREVIRTFREKYAQSPEAATDWYYKFSCDTDYIRRYRIAKDMRWKFASDYSEQYHHNYSILATPAEGLSGKFTKKDRKQFGIIPGVTDRDYYTNSNHVPVYYKCTAMKKAQVEAPYHDLTRGGHIFYVEIDGDATHNPSVIASVVDMMDKYNMGYGSVNHNRNRCLDCGYENAEANLEVCPKCGSHHIDKLQRITGYLVGTTDRWNSGKLAELHDRVTHIDTPQK